MKRLFLLAALLAFGLPTVAAAQVDRATLTGVVTDKGGAVLPGATVTLTNLETNTVAEQPTTATGSFLFVNLIPGRYQIEASLTGFKKSSQIVPLEVGQRARVDATLEVGAFNEVITVQESSSLLNANDGTLGAVVSHNQVANLPLAIRNWDDLLALVPGVQGDRYTEQGGGTSFGRTGGDQRPRRPRAAEQLPPRRRGQQQHLRERPGADLAGLASVGGRDSGVQGRHQPVLGGIRALAGRRGQRVHEVGHQRDPRHGVRLLPKRRHRRERLLLEARALAEAPERSEPVRRQRGRPARRRTRRSSSSTTRARASPAASRASPACRRPTSAPASSATPIKDPTTGLPFAEQHDPGEPHRSLRRVRSSPSCPCPTSRARTTSSATADLIDNPDRFIGRGRLEARRRPTASSAATSTPTASARSRAPSAASSTAPARRPSATRRSRPTPSSAAGRA